MLEKIDKKLLFALDLQARDSLRQLSKKLKVSKSTVDYRLKRLEKEKIILGYRALINSNLLGKQFYRLFISFSILTPQVKNAFELYVKKDNRLGYVYRCKGPYDYACAAWVDSLEEFQELANNIRYTFKDSINVVQQDLPLLILDLQNRYLLQKKSGKKTIMSSTTIQHLNLDALERNILFHLSTNARKPVHEIALLLRTTGKHIAYRIKKMEKKGIIQGYRAIINYKLLGYSYFKCRIPLTNFTKEDYLKVREVICSKPQVMFFVEGIGLPTIDFSAVFITFDEFYNFLDELQKQFPTILGKPEMLLFGEAVKLNYVPFL